MYKWYIIFVYASCDKQRASVFWDSAQSVYGVYTHPATKKMIIYGFQSTHRANIPKDKHSAKWGQWYCNWACQFCDSALDTLFQETGETGYLH